MKKEVHPTYELTTISCACGFSWETSSTQQDLKVDVCSTCHPFFTGEQRIVDTAGRVERFNKRYSRSCPASPDFAACDGYVLELQL